MNKPLFKVPRACVPCSTVWLQVTYRQLQKNPGGQILCCGYSPDWCHHMQPRQRPCHATGIFALVTIILCFVYLGNLDHLPRVDCCGCTCHTPSRYKHTPAPGMDIMMVNNKKPQGGKAASAAGAAGPSTPVAGDASGISAFRPPGQQYDMERGHSSPGVDLNFGKK